MPKPQPAPLPMLLTAGGGCAMSLIDTNVIAIAVPTLTRDLGQDAVAGQWVISAFFLGFAGALMAAGAIADRIGRRRAYLGGLLALALTSLICGLLSDIFALQILRAVQGVATAFVLAPALAMIGHRFRNPGESTRAWMIWGCVMGTAMVTAPLAGGWIVGLFGWRAAFFLNLPLCAGLFAATLAFTEESHGAAERRLDPAGIVLFGGAMFGMAWALINGQTYGWTHPATLAGALGGAVSLAGFVVSGRVQRNPMIPRGLFRDPRFVGAVWAMFAYAGTAQVMASVLPLFFQTKAGLSATAAGIAMLPFALAMLLFPFAGGWLGRRLPHRTVLPIGFLIVAAGNGVAASGALSGHWPLLLSGLCILGAGAGILNGEGQRAIMATIPPGLSGIASGISTTARFSGILMGFAGLNAVSAGARAIVAAREAAALPAPLGASPEMVAFSALLGAAGLVALATALVVRALLSRDKTA